MEAVTNAARHSGATACTATIAAAAGGVEVVVRDDGRGLDPARPPGVGFRSMRERAAEVGGTWSARSGPEGGTVVRAFLPVAPGKEGS
ncbi:hypothetical protein MF672_021195 [Actinomadura sp. ATCC 31491]|uniref:Histidine kinase/HSP90-like ATPase domain-containing protein n=1 Tax=Actinomadura luzonensis TaxID=2805427 RepID=A0ABT0FWN7_9ACTN|nr:ATP-binding protein [Actinomadura luzonensis]MCK2216298.1 hypothetical protein [Actinomadura luzonensis]